MLHSFCCTPESFIFFYFSLCFISLLYITSTFTGLNLTPLCYSGILSPPDSLTEPQMLPSPPCTAMTRIMTPATNTNSINLAESIHHSVPSVRRLEIICMQIANKINRSASKITRKIKTKILNEITVFEIEVPKYMYPE
jgi:hypothetical protein